MESLLLWASIPLRLVLGILFLVYGFSKLKSIGRTATQFLRFKIPHPKLSAVVVALVELVGGIALIIGFLTRMISICLLIIMLIAAYIKKTKIKKDSKMELVIILGLIILIILGAGNFSIDQTFGWLLG